MSNIIGTLTRRIEEYRATNKHPCKNYATKAAAEKATAKMAKAAAHHFSVNQNEDAGEARYIVFFMESWGRWVGAIDLTELLARKRSSGGYVGFCTGFYTY